ncbi:complex I subunit 5 family protein [Desulfonatronovibrio hydrogenovorans]|uniref:complex I subunit 5 family protein n=1 Tax=Desulfonatronovibrio hydrogenovorans TaxID=53245 RepID=UPI0006925DC1|nr:complex I subunit 5 family protein [Desulfonatronovibrio hydrogenovorans]
MTWLLAVFFPLVIAALYLIPSRGPLLGFRLLGAAALPALILALTAPYTFFFETEIFLLGLKFGIDPLTAPFLLVTALGWTAAGLFTSLGARNNLSRPGFGAMFLLAMCGNLGLVAARDAVSFYAFFALMTFSAYSLVVHSGSHPAQRAGRIYLIMAVLGEGLLIAGLMMAVSMSTGHYFTDITRAVSEISQYHAIYWLFFVGFGIKAGLIFLHCWLPLAHPAAPTPASAVLSASMIKAGLLGWINFFPVGHVSLTLWGWAFMILGLGGAMFGVLAGLREDNPKIILAYSSISQMGLISFAFGMVLHHESQWLLAWSALALLVLSHGLAKCALFLGVSILKSWGWPVMGKPVLILLLAIPALVLAGFPMTGGSGAKHLLKEAGTTAGISWLTTAPLFLSSVLTTLLMFHFLKQTTRIAKFEPGPALQLFSWLLLVGAVLSLPLIFTVLFPGHPGTWLTKEIILASIWPILLGGAVYLFFGRTVEKISFRTMKFLPDMAGLIDAAWHHLNSRLRQSTVFDSDLVKMNFTRYTDWIIRSSTVVRNSHELEKKAGAWTCFGFFFMLLILVLTTLAMIDWRPSG